jgi:hypothetical protein
MTKRPGVSFWVIVLSIPSIAIILYYIRHNIITIDSAIFRFATGIVVSAIFYFIVVHIPDYRKKKTIKDNISKAISFIFEAFSGNPFHWSKHIIHCKRLSDFSTEFEQYLDKAKNKKLSDLQIKAIIESANEALPTYEHLVAGALQLSSDHALIWLSLTNSIRQISTLYPFTSDTKGERDLGIFDLNLMEFVEYTIQWYKLA